MDDRLPPDEIQKSAELATQPNRTWSFHLIQWFVTGSFAGLLPVSPGTFGSLVGIPLVILWSHFPDLLGMLFTFVLILAGIYASDYYQRIQGGDHDRQEIVIDEICGMLITMAMVPLTWKTIVAGFLLFRFFDILKPWPISYLDRKIEGGLGVMVDDIAAGIVASILMQVLIQRTDWLGVQVLAS